MTDQPTARQRLLDAMRARACFCGADSCHNAEDYVDALVHELAEQDTSPVTALYERWVKAGPHPSAPPRPLVGHATRRTPPSAHPGRRTTGANNPEQPAHQHQHEGELTMGWGSAYSLFNTVADALIEARASDEVKEKALTKVIAGLQQEDWDTELDSLQSYLDDPAIVRAFANNDIHWDAD